MYFISLDDCGLCTICLIESIVVLVVCSLHIACTVLWLRKLLTCVFKGTAKMLVQELDDRFPQHNVMNNFGILSPKGQLSPERTIENLGRFL